jgi:hypothetical protein
MISFEDTFSNKLILFSEFNYSSYLDTGDVTGLSLNKLFKNYLKSFSHIL